MLRAPPFHEGRVGKIRCPRLRIESEREWSVRRRRSLGVSLGPLAREAACNARTASSSSSSSFVRAARGEGRRAERSLSRFYSRGVKHEAVRVRVPRPGHCTYNNNMIIMPRRCTGLCSMRQWSTASEEQKQQLPFRDRNSRRSAPAAPTGSVQPVGAPSASRPVVLAVVGAAPGPCRAPKPLTLPKATAPYNGRGARQKERGKKEGKREPAREGRSEPVGYPRGLLAETGLSIFSVPRAHSLALEDSYFFATRYRENVRPQRSMYLFEFCLFYC